MSISCRAIARAALLCLLLGAAHAAIADPAAERILAHQPLRLAGDGPKALAAGGQPPTTLSFEAYGRQLTLVLRENARLNGLRSRGGYTLLEGEVQGLPGSWVRLLKRGQRLSGMFSDGSELYVIEPRDDVADSLVQPELNPDTVNVLFRLADVILPPGALSCTALPPTAEVSGADALAALQSEFDPPPALLAQGATRRITLGAVADADLALAWGTDTEANILGRLNVVDGIFSEQLGLNVSLQTLDIQPDTSTDFTQTDANALLDQVTTYRQQNQSQYGLTHLFTGKNLDGSTRGIAWLGGACRTLFGAALSQQIRASFTTGALTTAHEIGHNVGALHDGEPSDDPNDPNPCDTVPEGYLMWPYIGTSSDFSQCSIDTMNAFLRTSTASCVTAVGPDGVEFSALASTLSIPPGSTRQLNFNVINPGAVEISDVQLQFNLPAEVQLVAGTPGCDLVSGPQPVCLLGNVNAGTTVPVSLQLSADIEGSYLVTLSLTNAEQPDVVSRNVTVNVNTVSAAASGGGGGGGGSLGLMGLAGLLMAAGQLRRRQRLPGPGIN